ncbi:MAG: non-canonical purine NTP diphosphatase [Muribaculaceae bacterium]|nr:non-canonical purine NTP diphosphatase [Muribaculaceae bacterium]
MEKIVFATNSAHKLRELRQMLAGRYEVLSLRDIECYDDIPETADTFEGNALIKAQWVKQHYGYDCFADDSGLEVDALGGAPGVMSARYAGVHGDDNANNKKLLAELTDKADKRGRFRCAIVLLRDGEEPHVFTGSVEGSITDKASGDSGFGYDPIFVPEGMDKTFAQISAEEKNAISHRGKAVAKLVKYLETSEYDA